MLERWNDWLKEHPLSANAALLLVAFAAYIPALSNGFVADDEQVIVQNPYVADVHWWRNIFSTSSWAFLGARNWNTYYRPFQIFGYWLIWRVDGANPAVYHLFQILLYAASVWLLYKVGCELIRHRAVAFAGALLWALHPLHVEAVAWAAALPDVAVGFFFFLAFLLFVRADRVGRLLDWRHGAAALAFGVGLLWKENALSLPLLMVAYWYFLAPPDKWGRRLARLVPYLAVLAIYIVVRVAVLGHFAAGAHIWSISNYVAGAALALLGAHLQMFLWPVHLSLTRAFNWLRELHTVWPYAGLAMLAAAWIWRKRSPLAAFGVFAWLLTLAPCLDIRQITTPFAADRYSYLPTFGLCWVAAWLLLDLLPRLRRVPMRVPATAALTAMVAVLWTVSTEATIPHWRNTMAMMQYGLSRNADAGAPHIYAAYLLQYHEHDLKAAAKEYRLALRVSAKNHPVVIPVICQARFGLGQIAFLEGRPEEGHQEFNEVLRLCPDGISAASVYDALGSMEFADHNYSGAADYFRKAVHWAPADVSGHFYLGTCEMKLGNYRQAAEQFRIVTKIDPTLQPAYAALARALQAAGDSAGAERVKMEAHRHTGP